MTSGKHGKRLARQRAAHTGESYTTALRHIRSQREGQMSGDMSASSKVLAVCSFCGKDNTEVKKLIAGPGVYICDECVGLCDDILATTVVDDEGAAARPTIENWQTAEILQVLPAIARNADSVESDLRRLVGRLRATGSSWEIISSRLGLEPDAALARFEKQP